jgi:hypothetical protein
VANKGEIRRPAPRKRHVVLINIVNSAVRRRINYELALPLHGHGGIVLFRLGFSLGLYEAADALGEEPSPAEGLTQKVQNAALPLLRRVGLGVRHE